MLLFGQEVRPGTRDELAVFWTNGVEKRAIIGAGYGDAHTALKRIVRKFDGGIAQYDNLRRKVRDLAEPGRVILARLGPHSVGLMRPYVHDGDGDEPYILCRGPVSQPTLPVLCRSYDEAQGFAKHAIREADLSRDGWCGFQGERLSSPLERLFVRRTDGEVILRSELEEALNAVRQEEREYRLIPSARPRRRARGRSRRTQSLQAADLGRVQGGHGGHISLIQTPGC